MTKRQWITKPLRIVLVLGFVFCLPFASGAQQKRTAAVLPFIIYGPQPLEVMKTNLQGMLTDRLAKYGISVIPQNDVNRHPVASLPAPDPGELVSLGKRLGADFVITGSLTQIGKRISLDLKALDIAGEKPPFSLFMVEDDIDRLDDAMDRASKSLYNQIVGIAQIDSVLVKGNLRVESDAILAVVESRKGESLDFDKLDKDLRAIYAMGYFNDVRIETEDGAKGKIVIFTVSEKPSIGKINYNGNKKIKAEDLTKESGIKLYSIYNPNDVKQSIGKLKDHYRKEGYYTVEITSKVEDLPRNEVALTYEIVEGEKVYIQKIEFVGNTKFKDGKLKDVMDTSEKGLLSWFTKSGVLDKKNLESDAQKITVFYQNQGYLRAKVGEPQVRYEPGYGLVVTIEIVEGDQYVVGNVDITGDLIRPAEELLKLVTLVKGEPFSRETVRKDVLALREAYADEGYAYAEVAPVSREDDKAHTVDITYRATTGSKVRFERITITGNTNTRDKVIRRDLEIYEGEYFSGYGMRKSTANLHRLGFFEDVEVQTKKGSADDLMDVTVNVKERPTGSFTMGAGYSGYEGPMGTVQVSQNNLFGTGQKLVGSLRVSGISTFWDLRYTEPRVNDTKVSAGVDLFKWEYEYPDYTRDSFGGALRTRFPIGVDDYTRGYTRYLYDDTTVSDIVPGAAFEIRDMEGRNVTSSITLGIDRDSKDKPWGTRSGSYHNISFEYAGGPLGGDVYFNRYEFTTQWFFPWRWDTSFMVEGRWGYVQEREGGKLPDYQKYRLGGITTVRGYDKDSIALIDPVTGDQLGGEKMMIYNFEFRFPLLKEQGVLGVVFFDAGNVFDENDNWNFTDIPMSAGAGIRWYSPLGPIRIEYGYILNRRPQDSTGGIEFQVGGAW
ncbi:MAG: outer membrane protein assembly factor BamA [Deltaproteobacteria bacterium]